MKHTNEATTTHLADISAVVRRSFQNLATASSLLGMDNKVYAISSQQTLDNGAAHTSGSPQSDLVNRSKLELSSSSSSPSPIDSIHLMESQTQSRSSLSQTDISMQDSSQYDLLSHLSAIAQPQVTSSSKLDNCVKDSDSSLSLNGEMLRLNSDCSLTNSQEEKCRLLNSAQESQCHSNISSSGSQHPFESRLVSTTRNFGSWLFRNQTRVTLKEFNAIAPSSF